MNKSKLLTVGVLTFALGLTVNSFAMSKIPGAYNVAVVDVAKVVMNSTQIKDLKAEQSKKVAELVKQVESARTAVSKETNESKRKSLEEGYNKDLNVKKQAIEKEYLEKMAVIDKSITEKIQAKAKADQYDIVLTKASVITGGVDITDEVLKMVK